MVGKNVGGVECVSHALENVRIAGSVGYQPAF
jgi:hypothetical protein